MVDVLVFAQIILQCGHMIEGMAEYQCPSVQDALASVPTRVMCPNGCGLQSFVVEPSMQDDKSCLCPPGRHICSDPPETIIFDLGYLEGGDIVEIDR